jgi:Methylamine utilisation protein MauE
MEEFSLMLDPVVSSAVGAALSVILLTGGLQKLRDPALFRATLANYRLLPEGWLWEVALLLPLWEISAGSLLLFSPTRVAAALLTTGLLCVVTAAVVINLGRGRTGIECGCGGFGGHVGEQTLSWALAARNAVLAAAALLVLVEEEARVLVWIDYLSVAFGILSLLGLYVTANQLMANEPRLQALRNH